jgi:hypothetical protein
MGARDAGIFRGTQKIEVFQLYFSGGYELLNWIPGRRRISENAIIDYGAVVVVEQT